MNPGGSNAHARAYNGPELVTNTGYSHEFLESMGEWWWGGHCNTWDASNTARNHAAPSIGPGEMGWTYYNLGDGIWL